MKTPFHFAARLGLQVFVEPRDDAFLKVELMCILLKAVSLARINHQLRLYSNIFQTSVELIRLADWHAAIVDTVYQERWRGG